MNDYIFNLEQILNIVHLNWLTINAFVRGRWKGLIIKVPCIIALAPFENHKGYIKKKYSFQKKVAQNIFIQKWSTGKVIKVKVLFFLLYLLWFTNGTGGYYTWNLDDQALSPPPEKTCFSIADFIGYFKNWLNQWIVTDISYVLMHLAHFLWPYWLIYKHFPKSGENG